jgi:Holliday junction resolvasome RuvABC endonuclease subunit
MGVDPGLASLGWAVLDGHALVACDVAKTSKQKPSLVQVRVSLDDSRRVQEICDSVLAVIDAYAVTAVAVEAFTIIPGKMAGGAMKTATVYGALCALAYVRGIAWMPLVPTDLKRVLCGRLSASKTEVQAAVEGRVLGAAEAVQALGKGKREHAADAIAAAIVGQEELRRLAPALGGFQ